MLTLNDGRSELWQWDTGRTVSVDADCSQVHFSNKVFGRSIDVDVVDGVAIIPDILLQTDKDFTAWAFIGTAENGYTKISKVFKVNKRNKPADYVFTPTDQTTLGELVERLGKIEESQDPDAIKNAVDDYLSNNPIMVKETDPTVPEWAKQPTPPDVKIPDKLPNPHSITFTGAVDASYDGSNPVEIKIPYSGGNVDLTGYATEEWVQEGYQPKGNYLTEAQLKPVRETANAAYSFAYEADRKVEKLREVVSKFHSNIVEEAKGETIILDDASDMEFRGLKVFGRTEQNGIPTPDAPVPLESVGDSVTVTVCGKNLIPYPYPDSGKSFTIIEDNGDGSLTVNGTTDKNIFFNLAIGVDFGDSYVSTYSSTTSVGRTFSISKTTVAGVYMGYQVNPNKGLFIKVEAGNTFDNVTIYPQIEYGNVSTDWESPNHQNILVSTSNGLPGIPVNSGGKYTDSSGQQWLCDEVDFENGVYVQRVDKHTFDGTSANWMIAYNNTNNVCAQYNGLSGKIRKVSNQIKANALCSSYMIDAVGDIYNHKRDNVFGVNVEGYLRFYRSSVMTTTVDVAAFAASMAGVEVVYELAEENPIPLSAEQLAAFAELHSNYPNTTVYNDAGAEMEVQYVADTKLYIDKKFDQLAAALLNQ